MKYIPAVFMALTLMLPGAEAYGETGKEDAASADSGQARTLTSCPKKGAEAAKAFGKAIERNADHVAILCLNELIEDHEKRLKALEAAKP